MLYPLTRLRGVVCGSLALLIATMLLVACSRSSDEQQLRDAMAAMQDAVERRNSADFMDHVADDFSAPAANMERRQLHDLLRLQLLRNERIGVTLATREIHVNGMRATVKAVATFTGSSGGWLPERGSVYAMTTGWRKDNGDWKLVQASWQRSL